MRWRVWLMAAFSATMVASVSGTQSAVAQAEHTSTEIRLFTPFGPDGPYASPEDVPWIVAYCSAGSLTSPGRHDVWRCQRYVPPAPIPEIEALRAQIYEPCYSDPFRDPPDRFGWLVCASSPWSDVVLAGPRALLGEPSRQPTNLLAFPPWALELSNGARCTRYPSADVQFEGLSLRYDCAETGDVAGEVDRTSTIWQAMFRPAEGGALTTVDVLVAWY